MEKHIDASEYRRRKKEEKDCLFQELDRCTEEIIHQDKAYQRYLDTQAVLDRYSVANAIMIADKNINAAQLKSFHDWKEQGVQVKRGEKSISLFEPYEYTDRGGNSHRDYRIKKVFDISQTTGSNGGRFAVNLSDRTILKALLFGLSVKIETVEKIEAEKSAEYSSSQNTIFVRRGLQENDFFQAMSKEICIANLSADESLSEQKKKDIAEAVSYMLCKRYGFGEPDSEMRTPEHMKNLTPKKARNELGLIRNAFNEIHERMYAEIEKKRTKNQERQEER